MKLLQFVSLLAGTATALTAAQWRSQSIYQIVTDRFANDQGTNTTCNSGDYCGGTYRGIINKLPYIQGMGFTAIWISPIVKNIDGPTAYGSPYHGYWAQDLYALNTAFGTGADLNALSSALHDRGMYLMVDVAPNHFAYNGAPSKVDYTKLKPFNDVSYYHPYCPTDYTNTTSVQQCWAGDAVVSLPDLRTENANVQQGMNSWIAGLVANYSIDGLRLDSAMAANKEFWPGFVNASKVYAIGEVLDGNPTTFGAWQTYMDGMLNYPSFYWIVRAFKSKTGTMTELKNNIGWLSTVVSDVTLLGNFIENHDQARFASYTNDTGLTNNAVAFTTFNDGIPVVYYGQEQGFSGAQDPFNREPLWPSLYTKTAMYTFIGKLNAARAVAIQKDAKYVTTKTNVIYSDDKVIVLSKGSTSSPLLALITNYGAGASASITVSGVPPSVSFTDLLTCNVFTSTSVGKIGLTVVNGQPRALYRSDALTGSNPCAVTATTTSTTSKSITTSTSSTAIQKSTSSTTTSAVASASATAIKCPASNGTSYAWNDRSFVIECGIDHAGGDMSMMYVKNLTQCIQQCAATTGCTNAALSGTACYLKSVLGKAVYNGVQGARLLPCTPVSSVSLTFNLNVTSAWMETIKILGSDSLIGYWNATNAVALGSQAYTASNTIWNATVENVPVGTFLEYKFIRVNSTTGTFVYEGGANRKYTVPSGGCAKGIVVDGVWQS